MSKCELFENIAAEVWDLISSNNLRGNVLDERGITNDRIIGTIQNYVESRNTFEVFAQRARNEVDTGGDLEIYIETGFQRFIRVFLQAKIMKPGNVFTDLDRNSGSTGRKQYDSLSQYAAQAGCYGFYIFYTGIPDFYKNDYYDCKGQHNEKQFGCALIKIDAVKKHCVKSSSGSMRLNNIGGPIGKPWRFLTCCDLEIPSGLIYYSKEEIDMDSYFSNLFTDTYSNFVTPESENRLSPLESINKNIHQGGWQPSARIIVTTRSLMRKRNGLLNLIIK